MRSSVRFPSIVGPKQDDICYATQNRQDAVKFMAPQCDVVIVVGSPNSSNSNRLREVAANRGIDAYMIDRAEELQAAWLEGKRRVGVTAGASAPEVLVREVIARLKALGATEVAELDGVVETIVFPLPKGLAGRTRRVRLTRPHGAISARAWPDAHRPGPKRSTPATAPPRWPRTARGGRIRSRRARRLRRNTTAAASSAHCRAASGRARRRATAPAAAAP